MPPLIDGVAFAGLIADKAFDSNALVAELNERGARIVISQHPARAQKLKIDASIYTWRHLIENFFCKLKEFKTHRHACLQDRPQLRGHDLSHRRRHQLSMNPHKP